MAAREASWITEAKELELKVDGKLWNWVDGERPAKADVDAWRKEQGKLPIDDRYLKFVRRHGSVTVLGLQFYPLDECGTAFGLDEKPKATSASGIAIHIFARALPIRGFTNVAFTAPANLLKPAKAPPAFTFTIWNKWLDGGPTGVPDKPDFDSFMAWWVDVMKQKAATKGPAQKKKTATKKRAGKARSATSRRRTGDAR